MRYRHSKLIEVKSAGPKNRGVFARKRIPAKTPIEVVPVLLLSDQEVFPPNASPTLCDYVFKWDKGRVAIALGYGSLYNHSYRPNAGYRFGSGKTLVYEAIRDIGKGEEITINYNTSPDDQAPIHFDVIDD